MGSVKSIRPSEEVRLKHWPPGRFNQLKIVVTTLEQAANRSLAGQVAQSPKRRFSEFVPIIPFQDIDGEVDFKEIRVQLIPPKGLKSLLFYEFQISRTPGFFNFETFENPDPSYVFTGLEDNTRFYIRMRVVTTEGLVGPFSDNLTAVTPTAKASGGLTKTETTTAISSTSFTDIFTATWTTLGGKTYYSVQFNCQLQSSPPVNFFNYSTMEFRWMENGIQQGQVWQVTNYGYGGSSGGANKLSIYDGELATAGDPLTTTTSFLTKKRGTFIQKFHSIPEESITIVLQAKIVNYHTLPNEFTFNAGSSILDFAAASNISIKNFTRFEVFTQA